MIFRNEIIKSSPKVLVTAAGQIEVVTDVVTKCNHNFNDILRFTTSNCCKYVSFTG